MVLFCLSKKSVLESVKINSYIDFNEIKNIIDYFLKDHEHIKNVSFDDYDMVKQTMNYDLQKNVSDE